MKRISTLTFILIGIAAVVTLVMFLAPNTNPNPDGLDKVAAAQGIDSEARSHALADGPLADYGVSGVDNRFVGTWVAGLTGVAVTFVAGAGSVFVVRRARRTPAPPVTS
jgi:cobalt/nickel transport system permease protein